MLPINSPRPKRRPTRSERFRLALFRVLYGPAAPFYDRFTDWLFLGEWRRWQLAALPLLPARGLVVELGPGTGALSVVGASPSRPWLGVEPSRAMLRVARNRRPREVGARRWLVRGSAQRLPLPDGVAAAVMATFPTPYIGAPASVAEIHRVLAPDGILVIVLAGDLTGDDVGRRLRRRLLRSFYGRAPSNDAGSSFDPPGFAGAISQRPTSHGVAVVYHGRRTDPAEMLSGI